MKKTLLIFACFTLAQSANAQITLSSSNAPSVATCAMQDSLAQLQIASSIPDFSAASNATWDLTSMVDSFPYHTFNATYSGADFPSATFNLPVRYSFAALSYLADKYYDVTPTGVVAYGEHTDRQALAIAALTGASTDSLVFPDQVIPYTPDRLQLQYPSTMGTTWTVNCNFTTAFELTVAAYSLSSTPGERRSNVSVENTVVGWGKMRLLNKDGDTTGYMDVLQLKQAYTTTDSFFLGGAPAPTALLTAFGLTQGQVKRTFDCRFQRAGEYTPLALVVYTDSTLSTPASVAVHRQRLTMPGTTGLHDMHPGQLHVFPNPVTNNSFFVQLPGAAAGDVSYSLYDLTGQQVATGIVPSGGWVSTDKALPAATYLLRVQASKGQYAVKQLQIVH